MRKKDRLLRRIIRVFRQSTEEKKHLSFIIFYVYTPTLFMVYIDIFENKTMYMCVYSWSLTYPKIVCVNND